MIAWDFQVNSLFFYLLLLLLLSFKLNVIRYMFYGSGCRISARSVGPGVGGADIGLLSLNTSYNLLFFSSLAWKRSIILATIVDGRTCGFPFCFVWRRRIKQNRLLEIVFKSGRKVPKIIKTAHKNWIKFNYYNSKQNKDFFFFKNILTNHPTYNWNWLCKWKKENENELKNWINAKVKINLTGTWLQTQNINIFEAHSRAARFSCMRNSM